jgi:MYXO-CTERM domain-containing protein
MSEARSLLHKPLIRRVALAVLTGLFLVPAQAMAIVPPDAAFVPFTCNGQVMTDGTRDPHTDHRDIVGDETYYAVSRAIDANNLYLRLRLNGDPRNSTAGIGDLRPFGWGFVVDAAPFNVLPDGTYTSYDYLVHLNGTGSPDLLRMVANDPNTQTEPNDPTASANGPLVWSLQHGVPNPVWHVQEVPGATAFSQGNPDFLLTFIIPWVELAKAGITPSTPVRMWIGSTNSNNSIDRDFACSSQSSGQTMNDIDPDPVTFDPDIDVDGIPDYLDNCPYVFNPDQADANNNDIGDACELFITSPLDGDVFNVTSVLAAGTAGPNLDVDLYLNGVYVGTVTADMNGDWDYSLDGLPEGIHELLAISMVGPGLETWDMVTFEIDLTDPYVTITAPTEGQILTAYLVNITGTSEPGSAVSVYFEGMMIPAAQLSVAGNGNWSTSYTVTADGDYTVIAIATDAAGNEAAATVNFVVNFNQCLNPADNDCGTDAICTNTASGDGYTCACPTGYDGDPYDVCTDIDECDLGTDSCDDNATCTNTPGSYTCACNSGYTGDGFTCDDINECELGTDSCDDNATCTNTPGSYTCACNSGYTGDGFTCDDINECDLGTDSCDDNATCTNTAGSYTCACNSGYTGDGFTCDDIDECAPGYPNICDDNATCTNTDGGYTCTCLPDYANINGNGSLCIELYVTIATPDDGAYLSDPFVVFSGSATPGVDVELFINGDFVATVVADADGIWVYDPGVEFANGTYSVRAVTTLADLTRFAAITFTVDSDAPAVAITSPTAGQVVTQYTVVITGTIEPSAALEVYFAGNLIDEADIVRDIDGNWSTTYTVSGDGPYTVRAVATSLAGVSANDSVTFTVNFNQCLNAADNTCGANTQCVNTATGAGFTCVCLAGFEGDPFAGCTDIDECSRGLDMCDDNATCSNTSGSYTCECNAGYEGDGFACDDIDECELGTDTCDMNATCSNTDGGYTCTCNAGYEGDGESCVDIDECELGTDSCDENATCTNTIGSYTCACNAGYEGDGFSCVDIDECELGTDTCDANATCSNTDGGYTCTCNAGYEGDGESCGDIDECALGTDSCDENATCTNTVGSYTCACNAGYEGDGLTCVDVDECELGTDTCDENATCTNTDGGFTCACNEGYEGDGQTCGDIDECALGIDMCDENATCENTVGGYTCTCDEGYEGNGMTCEDIDECELGTDTCDENATCTNTDGGFVCACEDGFTGDGESCDDIDECSDADLNSCDAFATCENTVGGYTCTCLEGYADVNGDGTSCVEVFVTVIAPADGSSVNTNTPTISGTATLESTVSIFIDGVLVANVDPDQDGNWSFTVDQALDDGTYDLTVTVTLVDITEASETTFTVDTEAPEVAIVEPAEDDVVTDVPTVITGTADPGTTIVVWLNGEVVGETTADDDGNWSVDLDADLELAPGTQTITVEGTDGAGNTTTAEHDFIYDPSVAVAITSPAEGAEVRTSFPTISGTGEPGQYVVIYVDGVEVAMVTVAEDGTWTWTAEDAIADGPVTVSVESTSEAGLTATDEVTFTIDTRVDVQPVTIDNEDTLTNQPRPTVTGSAAPNSTVEILVNGQVVGTVTADANGNWRWTPGSDLNDGQNTIVARPEGGTNADGDSVVITVDTVPPALTLDGPIAGATIEPGTVTVSGTAEPGAVVEIHVDGVLVGTTTADDNGNWSQDVVIEAEGDHTIEARARDAAGNETSIEITVTVPTAEEPEPTPEPQYRVTGGGPACASATTGTSTPASGLLLLALVALGLVVTRRRR